MAALDARLHLHLVGDLYDLAQIEASGRRGGHTQVIGELFLAVMRYWITHQLANENALVAGAASGQMLRIISDHHR